MDRAKQVFSGYFFDAIQVVVIAIALFFIIYLFIASPQVVVGDSMNPNYVNGEFLLTDKLSYRFTTPQRGDVIVLQYDPTHEFIKRILGVPGDTIKISDGHLYLNDKLVNESAYLNSNVQTGPGTFFETGDVKTVPKGDYFVLGDNREISEDSRYFGWIPDSSIVGRVLIIYYPLNKIEMIPKVKYIQNGSIINTKE